MSRTISKHLARWSSKPLSFRTTDTSLSRAFSIVHRQQQPQDTTTASSLESLLQANNPPSATATTPEREANKNLLRDLQFDSHQLLSAGPIAPFHLHCYSTRHNTHVSLTNANRDPLISISCGNLGFRKGARGTYEAAFQTSAWVMRKMQEKGYFDDENEVHVARLEVVLRGFAEGRQAFIQALMGIEGRLLRPKIVKVSDATRLKFGGARSANPRRLG